MERYINKDKLLAHIKDLPTWWADGGGIYGKPMKYPDGMFDVEDIVNSIENAPKADVVEVIRCRDCKYYGSSGCNHSMGLRVSFENDYCSYAER